MAPPQILIPPLGPPGGVPEEELKSEFNGKVAWTIIPTNFPNIKGTITNKICDECFELFKIGQFQEIFAMIFI